MGKRARGAPRALRLIYRAVYFKGVGIPGGDPRTIERFRTKWNPVRIKKTRQNKNLESTSVSMKG
jgi:hypothetical protein